MSEDSNILIFRKSSKKHEDADEFLEMEKIYDGFEIACKDVPESKLMIQWDAGDGWNIYRNNILLCNVPFLDENNRLI